MSVQTTYQGWKNSVNGTIIGDGQCVALVVNNSRAYVEALFPGVNWTQIVPPVQGAKDMAGKSNGYLTWIANDVNDANQLPQQGDIMVFDATPKAGYTNTFNNPYGHTGVCDSADSSGYVLFQQNSPGAGSPANSTKYAWKFRPTLGWYRPTGAGGQNPTPPTPPAQQHTITLPATTGPWHLYPVGGPYQYAAAKGLLFPSQYGGLTYKIDNYRGNGIYTITSEMFGQGDLFTNGSDVIVK